jgi:hypothetical protein
MLSSSLGLFPFLPLYFSLTLVSRADEHGQKVAASAEAGGRLPQDHCDLYVQGFKALNQRLCISNSAYIRTTDAAHKVTAQVTDPLSVSLSLSLPFRNSGISVQMQGISILVHMRVGIINVKNYLSLILKLKQ